MNFVYFMEMYVVYRMFIYLNFLIVIVIFYIFIYYCCYILCDDEYKYNRYLIV